MHRSCSSCNVGNRDCEHGNEHSDAVVERNSMNHDKAVKRLDEMESALVRAEMARKDIDLLFTMRIVREMLEDEVRKDVRKEERRGDKAD